MNSKDAVVGVVAAELRAHLENEGAFNAAKLAQVGAEKIVDRILGPDVVGALKFLISDQKQEVPLEGWMECEKPELELERLYSTVTHEYFRRAPLTVPSALVFRRTLPNALHPHTADAKVIWEWLVKPTPQKHLV